MKFFLTTMAEPLIINASLLYKKENGRKRPVIQPGCAAAKSRVVCGPWFANEEEKDGEGTGSCFGFWGTV
ncbi:MAG TPA: hypothetical protein DCR27_03545 [Lachnospiraceae bacterium]|nr:hypothetical protein [Lachnospiraceae bacterium]